MGSARDVNRVSVRWLELCIMVFARQSLYLSRLKRRATEGESPVFDNGESRTVMAK